MLLHLFSDTIDLYLECHNKVLMDYNQEMTWSFLAEASGQTCFVVAKIICETFNIKNLTPEKYHNKVSSHFSDALKKATLLKGIW